MSGSTILVACLTTISLASMISMMLLVWWSQDSAGRRSISAGKQQAELSRTMQQMVEKSAEIVGMQTHLTETLLLGRPVSPATLQEREPVKPSVTSPTPDELWRDLPDSMREALMREAEEENAEAGSWPSPSEMLQGVSLDGDLPDQPATPSPTGSGLLG